MATLQDAVDLGRIPLNDSDPTDANRRYPDATLNKFCNQALLIAFDKRPDLFVGSYSDNSVLPNGTRALTDSFPLPVRYLQAVADYITGVAEMIDDENATNGRAQLMIQKFTAELGLT